MQKLVKINNQHGNFSFWKASPTEGRGIAILGSSQTQRTDTPGLPLRKAGRLPPAPGNLFQAWMSPPSYSPHPPAQVLCSTVPPLGTPHPAGSPREHPQPFPVLGRGLSPGTPAPHSEPCVSGTPSLPLLCWHMRFQGDKYFRASRALRAKLLPKHRGKSF